MLYRAFFANNYSDRDSFNFIYVESIADVFRQIPYGDQLITSLSSKNEIIMNEKNLEYLKDNIKYMGFGEKMNEALENNMKQGNPEFTLTDQTEVNKKAFDVNLHFRKSDNSDMYFFNSYSASLQRSNGEKIDQNFLLK